MRVCFIFVAEYSLGYQTFQAPGYGCLSLAFSSSNRFSPMCYVTGKSMSETLFEKGEIHLHRDLLLKESLSAESRMASIPPHLPLDF